MTCNTLKRTSPLIAERGELCQQAKARVVLITQRYHMQSCDIDHYLPILELIKAG